MKIKKLKLALLILLAVPQLAFAAASRNLDNSGDRITQGDVFNVTTGSISACSTVKLTEDASIDQLIGKRSTTNTGWAILQTTADVMQFTASGASGSVTSSATTDCDGIWCVVCGTWNGSSDITTIYVNGVQEDQDDVTDRGSLSTGAFLRMGADGNATADYDGNGLWAYQAVWNAIVLTAVQVNEFQWKPELVGIDPGMLITVWGDATEQDLSAADDPAGVTNTTTSSDGPAVMFGGGLPI